MTTVCWSGGGRRSRAMGKVREQFNLIGKLSQFASIAIITLFGKYFGVTTGEHHVKL
jgi:hypothetical protein